MPNTRYTPRTAELRIFESDDPGAFEAFDAFATIVWVRHDIVCLYGLRGTMNRSMVWDIVRTLYRMGAKTIYAERAPGRRLPFADQVETGDFAGMWRVDLERFAARKGAA